MICGLGGDDTIVGGEGNDVIDGGDGFDWVDYHQAPSGVTVSLLAGVASGGAGDDTLVSIEGVVGTRFADSITGNHGFNDLWGLGGSDLINGMGGFDYARFDGARKIRVNLAGGIATGQGTDSLQAIEAAVGSSGNDVLLGSGAANQFYGMKGNDRIVASGGPDTLLGGPGADYLDGGRGNDDLFGGPGRDECYQRQGRGTVKSC